MWEDLRKCPQVWSSLFRLTVCATSCHGVKITLFFHTIIHSTPLIIRALSGMWKFTLLIRNAWPQYEISGYCTANWSWSVSETSSRPFSLSFISCLLTFSLYFTPFNNIFHPLIYCLKNCLHRLEYTTVCSIICGVLCLKKPAGGKTLCTVRGYL